MCEVVRPIKNVETTKSSREHHQRLQDVINNIDSSLSKTIADKNQEKIMKNFSILEGKEGSVNVLGVWKVKRKVFPKNAKVPPTVKKNHVGKVVTSRKGLLKLYRETFIHRLRQRPVKQDYKTIFDLKMELCHKRLKVVSKIKSEIWNEEFFLKTLNELKNEKSRDPHGFINELFKPKNIGKDLFYSLYELLKRVKAEQIIPNFMKFTNIHTVYKG